MLTLEEALTLVEKHASPLPPTRVGLGEALGLKLAEDIASDTDSPPHDKAMMDGYAVRSADHDPTRWILEEIAAGDVPQLPLRPGTASRIMTGAPLPAGADAVVPVEQTELIDSGAVRLEQPAPPPGQHVLPLGASMRAGDIVLRAGAIIRPVEIAIFAETGHAQVLVTPRPRIAVLATGNELVDVASKPGAGQIRNSNGAMLRAAGLRAKAEAIELPVARDTLDELTERMKQGLEADILVLSGGVSAGRFDLVPRVLAQLGVEQVFHKVALRPGKPLWFGVKKARAFEAGKSDVDAKTQLGHAAHGIPIPASPDRTVLVFGLPGNPVSSLVCFELFVRPAIAALAGGGFGQLASVQAKLTANCDCAGGRAACLPARLTSDGDDHVVEILPWQGSADLATLAKANGLARLPAVKQHYPAGAIIEVMPL